MHQEIAQNGHKRIKIFFGIAILVVLEWGYWNGKKPNELKGRIESVDVFFRYNQTTL